MKSLEMKQPNVNDYVETRPAGAKRARCGEHPPRPHQPRRTVPEPDRADIAPQFGEPNPIGEIEVLCRVYFPTLKEERLHFLNSVMQLEKRLLDLLQQQTASAIPTDDEFVAEFLTHYQVACEILMRTAADQVLHK